MCWCGSWAYARRRWSLRWWLARYRSWRNWVWGSCGRPRCRWRPLTRRGWSPSLRRWWTPQPPWWRRDPGPPARRGARSAWATSCGHATARGWRRPPSSMPSRRTRWQASPARTSSSWGISHTGTRVPGCTTRRCLRRSRRTQGRSWARCSWRSCRACTSSSRRAPPFASSGRGGYRRGGETCRKAWRRQRRASAPGSRWRASTRWLTSWWRRAFPRRCPGWRRCAPRQGRPAARTTAPSGSPSVHAPCAGRGSRRMGCWRRQWPAPRRRRHGCATQRSWPTQRCSFRARVWRTRRCLTPSPVLRRTAAGLSGRAACWCGSPPSLRLRDWTAPPWARRCWPARRSWAWRGSRRWLSWRLPGS
mmetsp:Transcript_34353/g.86032  ORF Transcript_34353/g.86032 Transcript_34353/m.86032 type:complete len:362 (-) Transcript_34353:318-1403(-)